MTMGAVSKKGHSRPLRLLAGQGISAALKKIEGRQ